MAPMAHARSTWKALAASIGLSALFLVVYGWCNWFTAQRAHVPTLFFEWERLIPFVPLMIVSIPAAMAQVRAGRLRPLAVSTKRRTSILPDVPTVAEATGLKGFEVDSWYAVFAPARTPDEVVVRMNKEIATVVARPDVKAKLLEQGAEGVSTTPEVLGGMVKREIAEWRAVVKRAGIEGD